MKTSNGIEVCVEQSDPDRRLLITCLIEDHGIGAYEFWGARGTDRRMEAIADCARVEGVIGKIEIDDLPESVVERAEKLAMEAYQDSRD